MERNRKKYDNVRKSFDNVNESNWIMKAQNRTNHLHKSTEASATTMIVLFWVLVGGFILVMLTK